MSLQCMKLKGVHMYGVPCATVSGRSPGGNFVNRLPMFEKTTTLPNVNYAPNGFSINGGGYRTGSYIGKSSAFSSVKTPYRGINAVGHGGQGGQYNIAKPVLAVDKSLTRSVDETYIKPSVLTSRGMLQQKLKWIYNSTYPNVWVQPTYPYGTMDANASAGHYIDDLKSKATIKLNHVAEACDDDDLCSSGKFFKTIKGKLDYDTYMNFLTKRCLYSSSFPFHNNGFSSGLSDLEAYQYWLSQKKCLFNKIK